MLSKEKVHINLFNLLTRRNSRSKKLTSNFENDNNTLSSKDLKIVDPSLKDLEFSWFEK